MPKEPLLKTIWVVPAAIAALGFIAYMTALSSEPISAQESATATPTAAATAGDLVVAPGVVEVGQTALAVGLHVLPFDLEVKIEYSGHFIPEDDSCDDAGTPGATQSAVAPTWVTLNACAVGEGWARLVESDTGAVIETVNVTVIEPGATGRQTRPTVTVSGVTTTELTPGGSGDEFSVRVSELEIATGYELHTVALNDSSAAFDQACTDFKEIDDVIWRGATKTYTVYGCIPPSTSIWSWVEDEDDIVVASSDFPGPTVNVKDPTVSFSSSTHSVDEGDEATVTVELSYESHEFIKIPITVSNGTAESADYEVDGLSSDGELRFSPRVTSASFTIEAIDDTEDEDDETVNIGFGTLPSTVSGTGSPSTATLTIVDDDENTAPEIDSGRSSVRYDECGIDSVGTYEASDDDGDSISWSLPNTDFETDLGDFNIVSGVLTFKSKPDYEDPDDSDGNNVYKITVRASDGEGGTADRDVTITVTNQDPTFEDGDSSVSHDEGDTGSVETYEASDPCGGDISWSLPNTRFETDRRDFDISSRGVLTFDDTPDYENPDDSNDDNVYKITIRASDGEGGTDDLNVTITVTNEDPTIDSGKSSVSHDEGDTGSVETYEASDPGGGDISWSLPNTRFETDRRDFDIDSRGVLTFDDTPDYEDPDDSNDDNVYKITIRASDGEGGTDDLNVTITVTNEDERGVVTLSTTTPQVGTEITATLSDEDGRVRNESWQWQRSSNGVSWTNISGATGTSYTPAAGDAGSRLRASVSYDDRQGRGKSAASEATSAVTRSNSPPTFDDGDSATITVPEGAGGEIGDPVSASDDDNDTLTYSLGGTDAASFSIDDSDGQLKTNAALDFETKNSYLVTVSVTDGKDEQGNAEQDPAIDDSIDVTITVTNENPTIDSGLSSVSYAEGGMGPVETYSASDPGGGGITWSLSGDDDGHFSISSGGALTFSNPPDFETKADSDENNEYEVTVTASDGNEGTDDRDVTITVTNVNEAPVGAPIAARTLEEGDSSLQIDLASYFSDPDADDTLRYTASANQTGVVTLIVNGSVLTVNRYASGSTDVTVKATDGGGLNTSRGFSVTVVNAPPTFKEAATPTPTRTVPENTGGGMDIGKPVSATDIDIGDTLTYSLSGTDASSFQIVAASGQLQTKADVAYDHETKSSYSVTVNVSDGKDDQGNTEQDPVTDASIAVSINVTNVDEPGVITLSTTTPTAGAEITATLSDEDGNVRNESWQWRRLPNLVRAIIIIPGATGHAYTPVNADTGSRLSVTVTYDDEHGTKKSATSAATSAVAQANSPPTFKEAATPTPTRTVPENTGGGMDIGKPVSADDPDNDTLTYSLSGTDASAFQIVAASGQLQTKTGITYDHEATRNTYSVTVNVTDSKDDQGKTELIPTTDNSIAVTINVTNVNEAPVVSGLTIVPYAENGADKVGSYTATDPEGDFVTWALYGIDHLSFAISFDDPKVSTSTANLKFRVSPDYENPADDGPNNVYDLTLKASDGALESAPVNIAVRVLDVNEPPSKPSAPTVSSNGETSLNVAWSAPTNTGPPINDYEVQYRAGNSGLFTSVTPSVAATQTTISGLDPDTAYEVQVRAKNAEGTGDWSDSGTGSTDAATLMVRIGSQVTTVTEGRGASFLLLTNISPATALTVNVSVTATGSFITGTPPSQATIAGGNSAAHLAIQTTNDTVDEANGAITVTVLPGAGYSVGSPSSVSVTVQDNDQPPAPTGLRANGNLVGGNVTLRWNPVLGATSYNVRYVEEVCDSNGVCEPDGGATPNWQTRTNIATSAGTAIEATLGGLTKEMLYRVEAQAAIVDASDWSDFTLVFPTDSPLGHGTDVATAPFHGYQAKNARGSHEFRYVLCTETIPAGLTMTATDIATDMKNAVDAWEDTVIWNRSGANIITTTDYTLPAGEQCGAILKGRFEVKFVLDRDMKNASCGSLIPWVRAAPACWRSRSWTSVGVGLIERGSVLLNSDYGATHWNDPAGSCTILRETIVHEVGHAFGIGNAAGASLNRHPINTTHSIMSYEDTNHYCEPQAYDIVALMALYQSR